MSVESAPSRAGQHTGGRGRAQVTRLLCSARGASGWEGGCPHAGPFSLRPGSGLPPLRPLTSPLRACSSSVNRPYELPLRGATAIKRDKYVKVSGTLAIRLYLRAPPREARGLESPRPAAGDGRRGSGAAEPGVQAAARGAQGSPGGGGARDRNTSANASCPRRLPAPTESSPGSSPPTPAAGF